MPSTRAAFLDRDGVINSLIYHKESGVIDSPANIAQFRILPRVPRAIRLLNDLGLRVVIVSNQPGIAKGRFAASMLREFDRKLQAALKTTRARVDAIYYCLHHPDAVVKTLRKRCACRKPGIGMLTQAASDLGLSLPDSYMVGDGLTDIEAGTRAGCSTVFVGRWKCEHCQCVHPPGLTPKFIAKDLWQAVQLIRTDLYRSEPAENYSSPSLANLLQKIG